MISLASLITTILISTLFKHINIPAVEDETNGVNRVLIFDTDVHQGDGTAAIFSTGKYSSSVYTCSIHCEENFPFRKSVSDLDVGLAAGTQDEEYLQVLAATFERAVEESRPDLVLYDAGVDVAASDRLGHLDLSDRGIYLRDRYVLQVSLGLRGYYSIMVVSCLILS